MPDKPSYEELERRIQLLEAELEYRRTETLFNEIEDQYRILVENAGESISIAQKGRLTFANPKTEELTGYSQPELLSKDFIEFIHPDDRSLVADRHLKRQNGEDEPSSYTFKLRHKSGKDKWVELNTVKIEWRNSPATLNFLRDITSRMEGEAAIQESEKRFRTTLDSMMEGCQIIGYDWTYVYINDAAAHHVRMNKTRLLGRSLNKVFKGLEQTEMFVRLSRCMNERIPDKTENEFTYPDGLKRWFKLSIQPVPEGIFVLSYDITERKQAESDLKDSEQRFRTLFEQSPIGIDLVASDGRSMFVNQALKNLLGYSEQEICGQPFIGWTHPDDVESSLQLVQLVRNGKTDRMSLEKRYIRKDGGIIWARTAVAAVRDKSGGLNYFIAMVEDISEEKRAEERLHDSETRYRNLFMHSPDAIFLNQNDRVTLVNKACQKLFGAKNEQELTGKPIYDLFHTDFHSVIEARIRKMRESSDMVPPIEEKILRLDGSIVDVEVLAAPFPAGEFNAIHVILRDITARKKTEAILKEGKEQLRLFIEHSPVALAMFDHKMHYIAVSRRWMVDYRLGDMNIIGRSHYDIFPEIPDRWKEIHRRGLSGEASQDNEDAFNRIDGTMQWLRWEVHPWYRADGAVGGIVVFTEDITASKASEEEHDKLREQLTQAQKMESIGRLAGGVSHDLNNLLSPILGYSEMLLDDLNPTDIRRESVNQIQQAGFRARDLVRQLLAFSRKQTLIVQPVNLNSVITGFEKLLRRTIPEDIEIRLNLSPDIKPVMADPGQIEQVIMNLAVNAADAMPDGGRLMMETGITELDLSYTALYPDLEPGHYVMLAISDTGSGMDKETCSCIFEPFFSTKGEQGTGLGLSTVFGIIKQHSGNIWVYSEPGKGTTFKIYLPVADKGRAEMNQDQKNVPVLKGSETILLVEDDEQVRHLARSILVRQGFKVLLPKSSNEALDMANSQDVPIHLLLTDVVMPEINGRELYEMAAVKHPGLKVLYMSGYTDNVIAHRGVLDAGVHFIQKPFTVQSLAAKVREVLNQES